tara:strand:+ start:4703 stop:5350 length:648 start_codon:yes stop_codon:yes gene_type:complete
MDEGIVGITLVSLSLGEGISLYVSKYIVFVAVFFAVAIGLYKLYIVLGGSQPLEFDGLDIGIGKQKIKLKPNHVDKQIAYKVWVELSTRKIGIPIDLEKDIISEVYDSWYAFFGVTRELIKDVPVSKFKRKDTERIIKISIEILNTGIRPHLTCWQASFRRWYEAAIANEDNKDLSPQEIQKKFPHFEELTSNMREVNQSLVKYRELLYKMLSSN